MSNIETAPGHGPQVLMQMIQGAGGRIAINDFVYDAALANPTAALFRTTMLAWTRKGSTYAETDFRRWLAEAGLKGVELTPSVGMPSTMIIAEKRS